MTDLPPRCACKERHASECPGEWEQGCDLGANTKFVGIYREMTDQPPLPKPFYTLPISQTTSVDVWASDQMLAYAAAYAAAAVTAEREACAMLCDVPIEISGMVEDVMRSCAAAIRARSKE